MDQEDQSKRYLLGMTKIELNELVSSLGMPKFTANQIADWIYKKGASSIDEMSNISLENRKKLVVHCELGRSAPTDSQISVDGTVKYLFQTKAGKFIETVMIPETLQGRNTLCVSSQVGCKMNCHFCMTGKQGFNGNLTANEIVNQIYSIAEADKLTNLVFMGMGEPLDNYEEVRKTLEIMTSDYGMAWSPRRITLSTIGVLPSLERFLEESDAHLAISIHSPFEDQRQSIMPVEKAYSIKSIIDLLKTYDWSKQRRLSFEYIMFSDFNDTLAHAKELATLVRGMNARVNLIRYHAIPNVELQSSSQERMEAFRDYLTQRDVISTIRTSRGEDIFAACGMLSTQKGQNN